MITPQSAQLLQFQPRFDPLSGVAEYDTEDGGVIVDFAPRYDAFQQDGRESRHDENLAERIPQHELDALAMRLVELIEHDDTSRSQWLQDRSRGIDLLGLEVDTKRMTGADSAVAGMSRVKHPLLLESCLTFHANARGELLPASGPVRVVDGDGSEPQDDEKARLLQKELNTYLTVTCTEYYPDTDKLIFTTGWSGAGFKKVFHCPLRRRPVSDSVDAKDLIIPNNATCIADAPRVTHVITMDQVTFKRMELAGAYRGGLDLSAPEHRVDAVDQKVGEIQGITRSETHFPDQIDRTIYECYCSYDLPGFEHRKGLPLPYKIVIDVTSRQVLEIRRNWREGDESYTKRELFVMYPFAPMFGFYPSGLLHILGNTTSAITTAWRILLDSGMFANFPGWVYAKNGARQQTPDFRVGAGQGVGIDTGGTGDITKTIMPMPYREPGANSIGLVDNIVSAGRRLGGTTELKVGEGQQQAPVGTTLAMLEQAMLIISAVHMRLHTAQHHEFMLLQQLLREDPEALWRHRRDKVSPERQQMILAALNDYDITPMADPNVPSRMHRLIKCTAVKQLQDATPQIYDPRVVDEYCLQQLGVANPTRFFVPPAPPGPDPNLEIIKAEQEKNQVKVLDIQTRSQDNDADRESRERIAQMQIAAKLAENRKGRP